MNAVPQLGEAGRTCASCRYFDAAGVPSGPGGAAGLCRFNAPSVVGWPSTTATDWCGEWGPPRTEMQPKEQRRVLEALQRDAGAADAMHPPMREAR